MSEKQNYNIELVEIPAIQVRSKRVVINDFPKGLAPLMGGLVTEIQEAGAMPAGAPILLYYDENYDPEKVDVEAAWPVEDTRLATGMLPAIIAARCVYTGPYNTLEPVYGAMMEWITQKGYRPLCPMREVYPNDPAVTPPEQLITEVIMPVEKAE